MLSNELCHSTDNCNNLLRSRAAKYNDDDDDNCDIFNYMPYDVEGNNEDDHPSDDEESSTSNLSDVMDTSNNSGDISTVHLASNFTGVRETQKQSSAARYQAAMLDLFYRSRASLKLYDDVIKLTNNYMQSADFNGLEELKLRQDFLSSLERTYHTEKMRPEYGNVQLHDGTVATVPVFDVQEMILSLLHDPSIMKHENLADGYDIFSGKEIEGEQCNARFGEIHTGEAWKRARNNYCKERGDMPIALIIFADKSHTDLHGALSATPVIFTLSLFNRHARNNSDFWRPIAYIPNLSYGKGDADRTESCNKLQDEHNCIAYAFQKLMDIRQRVSTTTVMERTVTLQVWIHYFIGDIEGNNKWLAHYGCNSGKIKRPYRDCKCSFYDLNKTNPKCDYVTVQEIDAARAIAKRDPKVGSDLFRAMSKHNINNALLDKKLPLSNQIHGPMKMMPPEMLHTSGSGLIAYAFESLADQFKLTIGRHHLDQQHKRMANVIRRQSERSMPRAATRNGIVDGTKCQSSERKGNLFIFMVIAHTTEGKSTINNVLNHDKTDWRDFLSCLKLYLAMEEWFHDANDKREVYNSRNLIARVLGMLQKFFPRKDNTNGYNLPKMHGITKMQTYMVEFGSGMNFFGGPGEAAHKIFVKAPGLKTQRRMSEFAKQTASQYYNMMLTQRAVSVIKHCTHGTYERSGEMRDSTTSEPDSKFSAEGKYFIPTSDSELDILVRDVKNKKENIHHSGFLRAIKREVQSLVGSNKKLPDMIECYTCVTKVDEDMNKYLFYAHPNYLRQKWYDWAYVFFEMTLKDGSTENAYYPSRILGFVDFLSDGKGVEAVIHCAIRPLQWSTLVHEFIVEFKLSGDFDKSVLRVPLSALAFPLCVVKNYGGQENSYLAISPKNNWGRYFGERIR